MIKREGENLEHAIEVQRSIIKVVSDLTNIRSLEICVDRENEDGSFSRLVYTIGSGEVVKAEI